MGFRQTSPTVLYVDNSGAVELSRDLKSCQRSRHIERRYLKVRELVAAGEVEVRAVDTKNNPADLFTKSIKWKGYDEVTPQWKSVLLRESCNQELIDEVEAAVAACKLRMNDRTDDEDDPVAEDEVVINEESDVTELAEKRRRRAPEKYSPTCLLYTSPSPRD